jgi:hypothetical protein
MKTRLCKTVVLVAALSAIGGLPVAAQPAPPAPSAPAVLTLPATGTFAKGGSFRGTISVNRFEQDGDKIVAVGMVAGVLSRGSRSLGTAVVGEVKWPVSVKVGAELAASRTPKGTPGPTPALWSPGGGSTFLLRSVRQHAESCPVVDVVLGPFTVDVLGTPLIIDPITVNLTGTPGTPFGDLVCEASELVSNVAAVIGVLNGLPSLLTTLLGGLTGGLGAIGGGVVPVPVP